jgi:peptidoglycan/LPS O-acetylase OafA/YrhL
MQNQIQKFEQIDCLRGVAAIMVVFVHASLFGLNQNIPLIISKIIYQGT